MKYSKKTVAAYMFRNLGHLFYVALPLAVAMAFFFNFSAEFDLYKAFVTGNLTLDDFWAKIGDTFSVLRFVPTWWQSLITLVLLSLAFSLLVCKISRHMKIGEMTVLPFKSALKIFPTMTLYVFVFFLAIEVFMLVPVGVAFLLRAIPTVYAITPIMFVMVMLIRMVLSYLFALLIVAFPLKYDENYRFNSAFAYSVSIMSKNGKLCIGFAVLYPVIRMVTGILAVLAAPFKLDIVVYALFYFAMILVIPCMAYVMYYNSIGGERRDIDRVIIFDRR